MISKRKGDFVDDDLSNTCLDLSYIIYRAESQASECVNFGSAEWRMISMEQGRGISPHRHVFLPPKK